MIFNERNYFTKYKIFSLFLLCLCLPSNVASVDPDESYVQHMLLNMNTSIDPCDDFYTYACGNWTQNYISEEYLDIPGYIDYMFNDQLLHILNQQRNATGIYAKLWNYYQACESLKSFAMNYYLKLVQPELNFQWPVFRSDWDHQWLNETQFDWLGTIAGLRLYGLNGVFLTQHVNMRLTNGSHHLIEIHQHQQTKDLEYKEVAEIFENFGLTKDESDNVTSKIIKLEQEMNELALANSKIDNKEELESDYYRKKFKELTLQELIEQVPELDWRRYFRILLNYDLPPDEKTLQTYALDMSYFDRLRSVLRSTSNETICYYIMVKFMYLLNTALPTDKETPSSCVKHMRGHMPLATNYIYEQHVYAAKRASIDAAIMEIFSNLKRNFEFLVMENTLQLNAIERDYILAELRTMRIKIGNVPHRVSRQFVERYYEHVNISADSFYKNHLQLLRFSTRRSQDKLRNAREPASAHFYEQNAIEAISSSPVKIFDNAVLVPYGYLQLPLFDANSNRLLQYSLLGFILAHEIVHAYDLFHIVFDQHGNYNDLGIDVLQHYQQFLNCSSSDSNSNDRISENMADITGLRLIYNTYFNDVAKNQPRLHATNGKLNDKQLFFVNSVQFLCANILKISTMDTNTLDWEHDMHDVRVRQNWANLEQFAEAFECKQGAIMHPERKCRLW